MIVVLSTLVRNTFLPPILTYLLASVFPDLYACLFYSSFAQSFRPISPSAPLHCDPSLHYLNPFVFSICPYGKQPFSDVEFLCYSKLIYRSINGHPIVTKLSIWRTIPFYFRGGRFKAQYIANITQLRKNVWRNPSPHIFSWPERTHWGYSLGCRSPICQGCSVATRIDTSGYLVATLMMVASPWLTQHTLLLLLHIQDFEFQRRYHISASLY